MIDRFPYLVIKRRAVRAARSWSCQWLVVVVVQLEISITPTNMTLELVKMKTDRRKHKAQTRK